MKKNVKKKINNIEHRGNDNKVANNFRGEMDIVNNINTLFPLKQINI